MFTLEQLEGVIAALAYPEIEITRDDERFSPYCALIGARTGPTMDLIQKFSDFHLLQITPQDGVLVTGFAAAYKVQGPFFTISEHLSKT